MVGSVELSWVEFFFCLLVELIPKDSFESFKAKHDLMAVCCLAWLNFR